MGSPPNAAPADRTSEELLERLLGEWVDRLVAGDAEQLGRDHPEVAEDFIAALREFTALGSRERGGVSATSADP